MCLVSGTSSERLPVGGSGRMRHRSSDGRACRSSFLIGEPLRPVRPLPSLRSLQKKSYREKCDALFGLFAWFGRFRTIGISNAEVPLQRLRSLRVGRSRASVAFVALGTAVMSGTGIIETVRTYVS